LSLQIAGGFVDVDRRRIQRDGRLIGLTAMESKLLALLAERSPDPVARVDLLTDVWGYRPTVQTRTVENTVRRLRAKLERDPSAPRHLQTERGFGYRFVPATAPAPEWPAGRVVIAWVIAKPPQEPEAWIDATETLKGAIAGEVGSRGSMLFESAGLTWGVAFSDNGEALSWAVDLQRRLVAESWPAVLDSLPATARQESVEGQLLNRGIRVSVGLATTASGVPPEYRGTARQRARQLADAALPGEILLSEDCWLEITAAAPDDIQAAVRPARRLLADPRPTFAACPRELVARMATDAEDSGPVPIANRLVGRDALQSEILGLLAPRRFVTLLGPPGVGKTALAASASASVGPRFAAVTWIGLPHCRTAEELEDGLAAGLGLAERSSIRAVLHGPDNLCILDNLEQLGADARVALARLLEGPEAPAVLATSRSALGIPGEVCVSVPPLAARDARRLFVQLAAAVRPGFARSDEDLRAVRQIAEHLEGLPLATEIAAARIRVLSPTQLADRLLRGGTTVDLHAAVAWSWGLLSVAEQEALAGLTVFQGPFDSEAAAAILGPDGADALDVLENLVGNSLLRIMQGDPVHFAPYVMVSEFASAQTAMAAVRARAMARHAAWAVSSCEAAWERRDGAGWLIRNRGELLAAVVRVTDGDPDLAARGLLALQGGVGRLDSSVEALVARIDRVLASPELGLEFRARLLIAKAMALNLGGNLPEAERATQEAFEVEVDDPLLFIDLQLAQANMRRQLGHLSEAETQLLALLTQIEPNSQPALACRIWSTMANVYIAMARFPEGAAAAVESLALARAASDPWLEAKALDQQGSALLHGGNHAEGRARLEQSLAILEAQDFAGLLPTTRNNLGNACQRLGDHDAAQRQYAQAIREREGQGAPFFAAQLRTNLATLQWQRGRTHAALELFDAAAGVLRNCGDTYQLPMLYLNRAGVYQEIGRIEPAIADYEAAAACVGENAQLRAYVVANRSGLHHELGQKDEAKSGYQQALEVLVALGDNYAATLVGARLAVLTGDREALDRHCAELAASVDEDLVQAAQLWRGVASAASEAATLEVEPCGPESRLALRILERALQS